ncbi:MAG: hypothetical protein WEB58_23000 [Planctomycetaceae bacterium]
MKAFRKWMRVVLPPTEYVALFLMAYAIVASIGYWILGRYPDASAPNNALMARDIAVAMGAMAYGAFRAIAFQPAYREEYLRFIKQKPWSPEKPLPLGPIPLVWQDIVVALFFLALVAHQPVLPPVRILYCGLMAYMLCPTLVYLQCQLWKYFYAVVFGIGLSILFWSTPMLSFGVLLAVYLIAYLGIEPLLTTFYETDVDDFPFWSSLGLNSNNRKAALKRVERLAGWPFDALAPKAPSIFLFSHGVHGIPTHHGVLASLLAGWWVFAIAVPVFDRMELAPQGGAESAPIPRAVRTVVHEIRSPVHLKLARNASPGLVGLNFYLFIALAGTRISFYFKGHHPPIDLGGRLLTGRWIIPKYDTIFVSPLCTLLAAFTPLPLTAWLGLSPLFASPISISLMVLCTLNLGPKRVDWLLTAPCRIVPSVDYKNKQLGEFSDS